MRYLLRSGDQHYVSEHNKFYHFISPCYSLSPIRFETSGREASFRFFLPGFPPPLPLSSPSFSSCHLRPGRDDSCAIMTSYFAGRELWTLLLLGVSSIEDSTAKPELASTVDARRGFAHSYFHTIISPGGAYLLGHEFYFRRVCSYSVKLCAQNNTRIILGLTKGKCEYDEGYHSLYLIVAFVLNYLCYTLLKKGFFVAFSVIKMYYLDIKTWIWCDEKIYLNRNIIFIIPLGNYRN